MTFVNHKYINKIHHKLSSLYFKLQIFLKIYISKYKKLKIFIVETIKANTT